MEEWVGKIWHRVITKRASYEFDEARVHLDERRKRLGIVLRALGVNSGIALTQSYEKAHRGPRNWVQTLAGTGRKVPASWREQDQLCLPGSLAVYPDRELNRVLYLWLVASGSQTLPHDADPRERVRLTLERYPLLQAQYQSLAEALLPLRPNPETLKSPLAAVERHIQHALLHPLESPTRRPASTEYVPVPLWIDTCDAADVVEGLVSAEADEAESEDSEEITAQTKPGRHAAERETMPDGQSGLLSFRLESLFSWTDYLPVDRTTDDDDSDNAASAADDMDKITVARDTRRSSRKVKLDLDLPAADFDDEPLGDGDPLPEWDFRSASYHEAHCCVQVMSPRDAHPAHLPARLAPLARRLKRQFESLRPGRIWLSGQVDGSDVDLDAYLQHLAERRQGIAELPAVYRDCRRRQRDLSCLVLADFSMSTDSWISNETRVIDVVQDGLMLLGETLSATRDEYAIYGFSSLNRQRVRLYQLKSFDQRWGDDARGRLLAVKPGYYTRMGAAIRHATDLLQRQKADHRLLLLLTDGKPNDLDLYEGRYGLEDTRQAILEARRLGITPFCVTIDTEAGDYLSHLFGMQGWTLVRNAQDLPRKLPQLYSQLTRGSHSG